MSGVSQVRESREDLIARARRAMRMAEAETLPNRALVHIEAAETWLRLAARKARPVTSAPAAPETEPIQVLAT